jgi:hypothetical protein
MSYIGYRLEINGNLSNKVHLNSVDELNEWHNDCYIKGWPTLKLVSERTGKSIIHTDNGTQYVRSIENIDGVIRYASVAYR